MVFFKSKGAEPSEPEFVGSFSALEPRAEPRGIFFAPHPWCLAKFFGAFGVETRKKFRTPFRRHFLSKFVSFAHLHV